MAAVVAPIGLLVTSEDLRIYRDRYLPSGDSIIGVGKFDVKDVFQFARSGNAAADALGFERQVQSWLETLCTESGLGQLTPELRRAAQMYIVPALLQGSIRSGHPRLPIPHRMLHVFVETNWVVAYAAPAHLQAPATDRLIERARSGKLTLHLPALCLTEARHPLGTKFQPRATADSIRKYLARATRQGKVEHESTKAVRVILDQYESAVSDEVDHLDDRLKEIAQQSRIEVFALSEIMLGGPFNFQR